LEQQKTNDVIKKLNGNCKMPPSPPNFTN
jgi:hypothetical protein